MFSHIPIILSIYKLSMKFFQPYLHILLFFLSLIATPPTNANYATKEGCITTCGNNVSIPFPFGIDEGCYYNQWYRVECKSSKPYLYRLNHEVLRVNMENPTVTISTPKLSTNCQNTFLNSNDIIGVDLVESPFLFSKLSNIFVYEGCGTAIMIANNGSELTGCSSTCGNVTHSDIRNCFGVGCCQTPIPHRVKSYNISLARLEEDGDCGYYSLVDQTLYKEGNFSLRNSSFIPISLVWTLRDANKITCCDNKPPQVRTVALFNGAPMDTWTCRRQPQEDSPSWMDGFNTCEPTAECTRCIDRGGKCIYDTILDIDDSVSRQNFSCDDREPSKTTPLGVILGVSISSGVFIIFTLSYVLFKLIKDAKERRQRMRFFKRNGGLLLKQQEEADPSLVDKTILFTYHELQKATDNFNENRILGRGAQGTVYKGMLMNGRIVAVKKSKIVDESQLELFINEVVILSQVNHRNVVKLLGCCLETNVPLLVSEFIPNGTLYDRLHNGTDEFIISFNMRLQIATEVAGALAYLHSATSVPIYHRDIKTKNILLDDKYRAKVSDFGTSRFASVEQTHLTTLVKGTFGYLDPEYFQSSQFTEKSDVYSFGVVLVELLTGERPISEIRFGEYGSLITHFMQAMEEGRVMTIFDAVVVKEGTVDVLITAANLAMRCLNLNGKYRPTMKEVARELETIRTSHNPSKIQLYTSSIVYREELSVLTYGESSTTFSSFNDSISK